MSSPGWFPDPDGSPRLRYFDGQQWTANTANQPMQPPGNPQGGPPPGNPRGGPHPGPGFSNQGQQPGHPNQGQQGGMPPHGPPGASGADRNNLWLWVAFAVVVALVIGVATWLFVFRQTPTTTPEPTPSVAQSADPTPDPTTPSPDPATPDPATPSPDPTTPDPEPSEDPSSGTVALPEPGAVIEPKTDCSATAQDAIGELGEDGRLTSGAGLSMPAADGYVPTTVQIPWVQKSNSQIKDYGNNWMSVFSVGTLHPEYGFTDAVGSAVDTAACLLGSDFYSSVEIGQATVIGGETHPSGDGAKLAVEVPVSGVEGVATDAVVVLTIMDGGVMHVFVATVPDSDPAAFDELDKVLSDLAFG